MSQVRWRVAVALTVALSGAAWGMIRAEGSASGMGPGAPMTSPLVRMTLEVDWNVPLPAADPNAEPKAPAKVEPDNSVTLALNGGQILEAVEWPARSGEPPRKRADGTWQVGSGRSGKVRVWVEVPLHGEVSVRLANQVVPFAVLGLLEGPQRTAPVAPVDVGVERVHWDVIQADWHDAGPDTTSGAVAPGAKLGLTLAYNILAPETTDVTLRTHAEIRPLHGGEPLWRDDRQEVAQTNRIEPAARVLEVIAPEREGTYIVEIRSSWEPIASPSGSKLLRWLRRRRSGGSTSVATRKMSLVVVGPKPPEPARGGPEGVEVDTIDPARVRAPKLLGSGRSPLIDPARPTWVVPEVAILDQVRRDRLLSVALPVGNRSGFDSGLLDAADGNGLAWSGYALRALHPGRPHRLIVTVSGGNPSALGVGLTGPRGRLPDEPRGRVLLDACASGHPILEGGPPTTFSWIVWPDAAESSLVLVNRNPTSPVRVGSIKLVELRDLAPNPVARPGKSIDARSLGLVVSGPSSLDRFGSPAEPLTQAENLSAYLAHLGSDQLVLPENLADRDRRRALGGQASEDPLGPDRRDLALRILARRGLAAWVALDLDGPLGDLPHPASPDAVTDGLVRLDRHGNPDGPAYHPLHPKVRKALTDRVGKLAGLRLQHPNLKGLVVRLGEGPTTLGATDTGFDDTTYDAFVAATFDASLADRVPGKRADDPERFAARAGFLEGTGRQPWLTWRAKQMAGLYKELASAAKGVRLAVVTPGLTPGAAEVEARKVDVAGLGPAQAWKAVGLDLTAWDDGPDAPLIWRGASLTGDDLGQDLATSRELDGQVGSRSSRGAFLALDAPMQPAPRVGPALNAVPLADGPAGDELVGHAVAELDPRWVFLPAGVAAGQEDRLRQFTRLFAALPAPPPGKPEPVLPVGIAARVSKGEMGSFLSLANDTPYPIRIEAIVGGVTAEARVDDLGRGIRLAAQTVEAGRRLVLDVAPFGLSVMSFPGSEAHLAGVTPYPGTAVLDGMKAQFEGLSGALDRLNRQVAATSAGDSRLGPADPGFEAVASLKAWKVVGSPMARAELDAEQKHSGSKSLRLKSPAPAAIAGEIFRPAGRSSLTIHAWLRAERPDARVRVWIDGESAGRPFFRQLEVLAQVDWTEMAVRTSRLPAGGLDSARVRFELLDPGTLWVDDVSITGDPMNESERLNARRDLMAALSAYQEQRYGDFARLAGSHWARYVAPESTLATVGRPSTEPGLIRTGDAGPSALPPDRRLR